jgi:type II secretory pathway pseudopilin PulG
MKNLPSNRLKAMSLIELGLVLLIIGVILGAVFKGQELLQVAKINSVLDDVKRYKSLVLMYQQTYGEWPGDDSQAIIHFGKDTENGNGDGSVSDKDETLVWQHLALSGYLSHSEVPSSRLGGKFRLTSTPNQNLKGLWLILGQGVNSKGGLITPKVAQQIKQKANDGNPNEGMIRFFDGEGSSENSCIKNNAFNIENDQPVCVMAVNIS